MPKTPTTALITDEKASICQLHARVANPGAANSIELLKPERLRQKRSPIQRRARRHRQPIRPILNRIRDRRRHQRLNPSGRVFSASPRAITRRQRSQQLDAQKRISIGALEQSRDHLVPHLGRAEHGFGQRSHLRDRERAQLETRDQVLSLEAMDQPRLRPTRSRRQQPTEREVAQSSEAVVHQLDRRRV